MRCFIAIPPTSQSSLELGQLQDLVLKQDPVGMAVPKENFHLTLAFIGELSQEKASWLAYDLSQIPFDLDRHWRIDRCGCFSKIGLFFASGAKNEYLNQVARKTRELLEQHDISYDRKEFRPHVTLLRHSKLKTFLMPKSIDWLIQPPVLFKSVRNTNNVLRYIPVRVSL